MIIFLFISTFVFAGMREENLVKNLIEMFLMDDGAPPNFSDINSFLDEAVRRGYIEEDALKGLNFKDISFREILDVAAGLQPAKKTVNIAWMVVDETTGDLYVAARTAIYKVDLGENVSLVKSGFTSIYGIDLVRETAGDPGFMVVADSGAKKVFGFALDNISAPPQEIATNVQNLRAVLWGRSVLSQTDVNPTNELMLNLLYNNGNSGATSRVLANPMVEIMPYTNSEILISSPDGAKYGVFPQGYITLSDTTNSNHSTAFVRFKYFDNKDRLTCAWMGDPGKAASYDPNPQDPTKCDRPYNWAGGICDNKDQFSSCYDCVGSFKDSQDLKSCKICGSYLNPCQWEFVITDRYGGDNYKVYFQSFNEEGALILTRASHIYTAVKNVFIERDKMCRNGGLLYEDFDHLNCSDHCNQIKVYDWMNGIDAGNSIVIFDETKPFESSNKEIRTALHIADNGDGTKTITLDSNLQKDYYASSKSGNTPTFSNGHSAGICLNTNDNSFYYIADTSDLRQPFDDGFVKFNF